MFYDMGATSTVATIVGKFVHQPIASGFVECKPGVLRDSFKPTNNHCMSLQILLTLSCLFEPRLEDDYMLN